MLETLDYTIRIASTPTFSYFDLYTKYTLPTLALVLLDVIYYSPRSNAHARSDSTMVDT